MSPLIYEYTITYRPAGDERSIASAPSVIAAGQTPEDRCHKAKNDLESLQSQGYEILAFTTRDNCPECLGRGKVMRKPKGWRKRHNPPAWMMVGCKCPTCGGDGLLKA